MICVESKKLGFWWAGSHPVHHRHPIKVGEEKFHGDDMIITIYRIVPDYVVGRSASCS